MKKTNLELILEELQEAMEATQESLHVFNETLDKISEVE